MQHGISQLTSSPSESLIIERSYQEKLVFRAIVSVVDFEKSYMKSTPSGASAGEAGLVPQPLSCVVGVGEWAGGKAMKGKTKTTAKSKKHSSTQIQ